MTHKKPKPSHPGVILDELYIKPLNLNIRELAENLGIARNTLYKIRAGKAGITAAIAIRLSEAFGTTPNLWLNLQQQFDLWVEENEHTHKTVLPVYLPKKSRRAA